MPRRRCCIGWNGGSWPDPAPARRAPRTRSRALTLPLETGSLAEPTLNHWVKADCEGRLIGAGSQSVSPEQIMPSTPNAVRTSDTTYGAADEGWLHLAMIID